MGTDWRDNEPQIEPVVEIYQGARNSYEVVGGPRVHDIATQPPQKAPWIITTGGREPLMKPEKKGRGTRRSWPPRGKSR